MNKQDKADIIQAVTFIVTGIALFAYTLVFAVIIGNVAVGIASGVFLVLPILGVMILRGLRSGED